MIKNKQDAFGPEAVATVRLSPLLVRSSDQVFRENGGAGFSVTAVDVTVRSTGQPMTIHFASVKDGIPGTVCLTLLQRNQQEFYLLARHWRVAINDWQWEFPRGMGEPGESPIQTAIRELKEETGLNADPSQVRELHHLRADPGVMRDDVRVMELVFPCPGPGDAAMGVIPLQSGIQGKDWELSDLRWIAAEHIKRMICKGQIVDGLTISSFAIREFQERG